MIKLSAIKQGMTRLFLDSGVSVPVTVVRVEKHTVVQVKTVVKDGYSALKLASGERRASLMTKPIAGQLKKAQLTSSSRIFEMRLNDAAEHQFDVGHTLDVTAFKAGDFIDVTGVTKGAGFAGCVKRHGFRTQDMSHGNSVSHRAPGSIGQNQSPGRVFKGKKMAGHMGNVKRTVQSLEVVGVKPELGVLLIKGGIPGSVGNVVFLSSAEKKS